MAAQQQQQPPLDVSLRESKLSSPEMPLEGGMYYVKMNNFVFYKIQPLLNNQSQT